MLPLLAEEHQPLITEIFMHHAQLYVCLRLVPITLSTSPTPVPIHSTMPIPVLSRKRSKSCVTNVRSEKAKLVWTACSDWLRYHINRPCCATCRQAAHNKQGKPRAST